MNRVVGFILGFGVTVAYVPNVTGSAVLTGWPFLAGLLPFLLWRRFPGQLSPLHWLGLGFIAWAGLSLLWTENIYDGIGSLAIWIILGMAFQLGSSTPDARPIYFGICVGVSLATVVAVAQTFGWQGVYTQEAFTSHVPSLYVNSTVFGTICALVLVLAFAGGHWWFLPMGVLGLWLSGARMPAVAAGIAGLVCVWVNWSRMGVVVLLVPFALFVTAVFVQKGERDIGNSGGSRLAYWVDAAESLTWKGHGVGSYVSIAPSIAKRSNPALRAEHPYSDPLEVLFEFGLGAILLFWLLTLALEVPLEPERSTLLAFLISGTTYPNLALPVVAFLAAFVAGRLARWWPLVRCGEYPRRPELPHWLGVGGYVNAGTGRKPLPVQSGN